MYQQQIQIDMNSTEVYAEAREKAYKNYQSSLNNINRKELSYLRNCMKLSIFNTEWFEDVEESGMVEIGVGIECEEFILQINVSVELTKEDETNYSQINVTDLQIDNILNFQGNQIEWCEDTEEKILNKLK